MNHKLYIILWMFVYFNDNNMIANSAGNNFRGQQCRKFLWYILFYLGVLITISTNVQFS